MYPKPKRVVSRETINELLKRIGTCEIGLRFPEVYGACIAGLHPHHIVHRGAGGGDVPENILIMCPGHHDKAHTGEIPKDVLLKALSKRYYVPRIHDVRR